MAIAKVWASGAKERLFQKLESRKLPQSAITEHRRAVSSRLGSGVAAGKLLARLDARSAVIAHGSAFADRLGRVVLVIGPSGIGKSTGRVRLTQTKIAEPIEDGHVILHADNGRLRLTRTSTVQLYLKRSFLSRVLREKLRLKPEFLKGGSKWKAYEKRRMPSP